MMYLKINRNIDYVWYSIDYWINVAKAMGDEYLFICDNEAFKQSILEKFAFLSENQFIESDRDFANNISKQIAIPRWEKASNAHLTTFIHAKEHGIKKFWNIDADDTAFGLSPQKTALLLKRAELYADAKGIDVFGLDMWWTVHGGDNWTFGITYTSNERVDLLETVERHCSDQPYLKEKNHYNIDCFFNYLRNSKLISVESFYFQNCHFIHWGAPFGPVLYRFQSSKVIFPRKFLYLFTKTLKFGKHRILPEVITIENEEKREDSAFRKQMKRGSKLYNISPLVFILKTKGFKGLISLAKQR